MEGNPVKAIEFLKKAVIHSDNAMVVKPDLACALILADRQGEAEAILEELEKQGEEGYVPSYYLGKVYAGFGRVDEAFEAFDRALEERDWYLFGLRGHFSFFHELETDPRWSDLVRRVGLPPE